MSEAPRVLEVAEADAGQRVDRFLRKLCADVPLSALFRALRKREITVDGARVEPGARLEAGARVEFRGRAAALLDDVAEPARPSAWRGPPIGILYRDDDIAALDKPSGVAVQPGGGPSLADWIAACAELRAPAGARTVHPGPAHRLDRGTSGVVLVGLSGPGVRGLAAAFREGRIEKSYVALVCGVPDPPRATIDAPLRVLERAPARGPKVVVDPRGLAATTHFEVAAVRGDDAVLHVRIETGRTHQIRAHLAHAGHPLRGDRRYGGGAGPMRLHAWRVELVHPVSGERLRIEAPVPDGLRT